MATFQRVLLTGEARVTSRYVTVLRGGVVNAIHRTVTVHSVSVLVHARLVRLVLVLVLAVRIVRLAVPVVVRGVVVVVPPVVGGVVVRRLVVLDVAVPVVVVVALRVLHVLSNALCLGEAVGTRIVAGTPLGTGRIHSVVRQQSGDNCFHLATVAQCKLLTTFNNFNDL